MLSCANRSKLHFTADRIYGFLFVFIDDGRSASTTISIKTATDLFSVKGKCPILHENRGCDPTNSSSGAIPLDRSRCSNERN